MDTLTHTFSGVALAEAGLKRRSPGAYTTLVLAANAPDVDAIAGLWGSSIALDVHRGITHSLFVWPAIAAILAAATWLAFRRRGARFGELFRLSLLGTLVHIFLDLTNAYGTRLLLPFSTRAYALDWTSVIEPLVLLPLILVGVWFRRKRWGPQAARYVLAWSMLALVWRGVAHAALVCEVRSEFDGRYEDLSVIPYPITPFHWHVVVDRGGFYSVADVSLFSDIRDAGWRRLLSEEDNLAVRRVASNADVASMMRFSRHPIYTVDESDDGATIVSLRDLRFDTLGRNPFVLEARILPDGTVATRRRGM